jgi:hypothetical protein
MRRGLDVFSWFIYRVTTPAMRHLFMDPTRHFGLKAALLSVLAGDIYRRTPIGPSLFLFKIIYYLHCALDARKSFMAWRRRKRSLRDPQSEAAVV